VTLELPRFKFKARSDLSQTLADMGMASAFGPGADFSGMTGNRELFIGKVVHEAFVEVNEEGTEAAAATGVVMTRASIPHVVRADRPFLFLIRSERTGSWLCLGRVANPAE
jgi:serpin B